MSYPTVGGDGVEGVPYREAQSCLGPAFTASTYQFFLTGTTTAADVYQDGALTTPFPIKGNVASDNFGRFPPIYLDNSVIYRVQLYNAANVLQWQVDPYTPPLATNGTSSTTAFGMTIAATGEVTIPAPSAGGSTVTLTLNAGALGSSPLQLTATLPGQSALIINSSATTGAQTATFTATNKPGTATSTPAGWLPITCDGVQYYTPIWHGNNFTPYVASPTALGEVINAVSVTFNGNGTTTATGGTATPSNWYSPTTTNIGGSYSIKITKTSGLSGVVFSTGSSLTPITTGGLTVTENAAATITGTYILSIGGVTVANGTITLSGGNGVQQPTYNGAANLVLNSDGTATLNGVATSNWYSPTTAAVGTGRYIKITQTGGTSGTTFSAATSYTQIGAGLTIGVTGGTGTTNASGTYIIASDSGGVTQLGTGSIALTGGSAVQSPNWSGTTPLVLAGNGSATLNGSATSSWYSPNVANTGSGYWIKITRTSGTTGVNFSAAQGSWTNITNAGLTIGMTGYTGDVGTVTVGGTYQISSSSGGSPVLGSGTIALSLSGLTVTRTYTGTSGTETAPTGASFVTIQLRGGGGNGYNTTGSSGFGGSGSGYSVTGPIAITSGQTLNYALNNGTFTLTNNTPGAVGAAGSITSGTKVITTMSVTGGGGGQAAAAGSVGTATGGTVSNVSGSLGLSSGTGGGGGDGSTGGAPGSSGSSVNAGNGRSSPGTFSSRPSSVTFIYT